MQLGIGSYTYGWSSGTFQNDVTEEAVRGGYRHLSAHDLVDRAVGLDVPVVQICVLPDLRQMDEVELRELRGYAEDRNVALELGTVGSDVDNLLRFLHIAQALGAGLVRTNFRDASPGLTVERERFGQIADRYARAQVVLAIENYERTSFLDLAAFCREMDSEYIGVCLDTVNSLGRGEGVREVTEGLMPYTKCLHAKDFRVTRDESDMAFIIEGAPLGEGLLDFAQQMRLLHEYRPNTSIILEQWMPFQGTLDETERVADAWAKTGLANLRRWQAEIEGA